VTIDHLVPKSLGGSNDIENLVPCCAECNREKADRMPTEDELTMARQWRGDKPLKPRRVKIATDLKEFIGDF